MQEFVVFVVAASMCVLCFAVGFVAALNLRIAERTSLPLIGGPRNADEPTPSHAEQVQPTPARTSSAPAAVVSGPAISLPHAERSFEQHPGVAPLPMRPATAPAPLPQRPHAVPSVGFAPPMSPPAKVFLFGEPHVEPVVVPSATSVPVAPEPNRWATAQQPAPQALAPAPVELLPRRPQYARSGRRR